MISMGMIHIHLKRGGGVSQSGHDVTDTATRPPPRPPQHPHPHTPQHTHTQTVCWLHNDLTHIHHRRPNTPPSTLFPICTTSSRCLILYAAS